MSKKLLLGLLLAMLLVLSSCSTRDFTTDNICRQEPCYEGPFDPPWVSAFHAGLEYISPEGTPWTHDNRVYESANFLIFSESSGDEAKILLAESCEQNLARYKTLFQVTSQDLGIVDQQSKFHIFSIQSGNRGGDRAATNGFAIQAFDSDGYLNYEPYRESHPRVIAHELAHVVQYNLGGYFNLVHDWFVE